MPRRLLRHAKLAPDRRANPPRKILSKHELPSGCLRTASPETKFVRFTTK